LRSAAFDTENILAFYKTTYLNEEVNCTQPFLSVRVPWFEPYRPFQTTVMFLSKANTCLFEAPEPGFHCPQATH
jgi:hypothetical protein